MATVLELRAIADYGDDRRRGLRTDTLDFRDALASFVTAEHVVNFLVERSDPPIQIPKEVIKLGNGFSRHRCQLVVQIGQNVWDLTPSTGDAFGEGEAAIQEQPADLTNNGSAVIDHSLPSAMQGLDILLLDGFLWDEWDMRLRSRRADRFRVIAVVLLPTNE